MRPVIFSERSMAKENSGTLRTPMRSRIEARMKPRAWVRASRVDSSSGGPPVTATKTRADLPPGARTTSVTTAGKDAWIGEFAF